MQSDSFQFCSSLLTCSSFYDTIELKKNAKSYILPFLRIDIKIKECEDRKMYCQKCGKEINESDTFCPGCGAPTTENAEKQVSTEQQTNTAPASNIFIAQKFQLNWYKALIYAILFLSAIVNFANSIKFFRGTVYGDSDTIAAVYDAFPTLKPLDICTGCVLLGIAVLAIITRFALAKFKKSGPPLLYAVYLSNIIYTIVYAVAASAITKTFLLNYSTVFSVIVSIVMLFANYKYFTKRKELFVK